MSDCQPEVTTTGAEASSNPVDSSDATELKPVSKKALKRQAKRHEWEEKKKLKRKLQKEKRKEMGFPNRSKGGGKRRRRFNKMETSSCKLHIAVDLSFDDLMMEKDLSRCASQVNRSYSVNRALPNPVQFHVTSFSGPSTAVMAKQIGFTNWDVKFHEEPYDQVFEKDRLVYLTSESRNVLDELDENKVYVIGGLVDHNAKKGLCYSMAVEKGIAHARLPIREWIDMKTRSVLSINQLFSIVANVAQGKSWQEAILNAIPQRKNAQPKNDEGTESESEAEGSDGGDEAEDSNPPGAEVRSNFLSCN